MRFLLCLFVPGIVPLSQVGNTRNAAVAKERKKSGRRRFELGVSARRDASLVESINEFGVLLVNNGPSELEGWAKLATRNAVNWVEGREA